MKVYGIIVILFIGFHVITANVFQRSTGVCECRSLWWVRATSVADIPANAVFAGTDKNLGGNVYVGRTFYKNELVPGKVVHRNGRLYIPYGGKEIEHKNFEVLVSSAPTRWVNPTEDRVPPGAAFGGYNKDNNDNFYICRVFYDGHWVPGKLNTNKFVCFFSIYGKERTSKDFEVLVLL